MASTSDSTSDDLQTAIIHLSKELEHCCFERLKLACSAGVLSDDRIRDITEFHILFTVLKQVISSTDKAVAFCCQVLKRLGYRAPEKFRIFACPEDNFNYQQQYPKVDCMLTVLEFLGNLTDHDFSIVRSYISNKTGQARDRLPTRISVASVLFNEDLISEDNLLFILNLAQQFNRKHMFNDYLKKMKTRQDRDDIMRDGGSRSTTSSQQPSRHVNASTTATEDRTESGAEIPDLRLYYMSKIQQCIETDQELQQGIIFVITMYGIQGSDRDRDRVTNTFKKLSFAVFPETSLSANDLGWLMQAASQVKYPYTYKYIAFYYSGHGMIDENGIEYIGTRNQAGKTRKMEIKKYITNPLLRVENVHKLFLFDCCRRVNDKSPNTFTDDKMDTKVPKHGNSSFVIAYSVSPGEDTTSTRVGSKWTHDLCHNLDKGKKKFMSILSDTMKTPLYKNIKEDFIIKQVHGNVYADLLERNLDRSKDILKQLQKKKWSKKDVDELVIMIFSIDDDEILVKEIINKIRKNLLSLNLIDSVCCELQLQ